MKATDTPLGGLTRVAQWLFIAAFLLFCFGSWMDSSREHVDRSHVSIWLICWIAFLTLILTIETAAARILYAIEHAGGSSVEPTGENRAIRAPNLKGKYKPASSHSVTLATVPPGEGGELPNWSSKRSVCPVRPRKGGVNDARPHN
jgi:hypothetical protein